MANVFKLEDRIDGPTSRIVVNLDCVESVSYQMIGNETVGEIAEFVFRFKSGNKEVFEVEVDNCRAAVIFEKIYDSINWKVSS